MFCADLLSDFKQQICLGGRVYDLEPAPTLHRRVKLVIGAAGLPTETWPIRSQFIAAGIRNKNPFRRKNLDRDWRWRRWFRLSCVQSRPVRRDKNQTEG